MTKIRESGMPDESVWRGFFDPGRILSLLDLDASAVDAVEFGCGYGTFTLPAAQLLRGRMHAFDIESDMIAATRCKADALAVSNIEFHLRDLMAEGTGLPDESAGYVMLFNILHAEDPRALLREAHRLLRAGGKAGIIHWNYDPRTPRGPSMEIRPKPEQCRQWAEEEGFRIVKPHVDLPPYHYGIVASK